MNESGRTKKTRPGPFIFQSASVLTQRAQSSSGQTVSATPRQKHVQGRRQRPRGQCGVGSKGLDGACVLRRGGSARGVPAYCAGHGCGVLGRSRRHGRAVVPAQGIFSLMRLPTSTAQR